jgi:hypothetical protein
MLKEFVVTLKNREDLESFYNDMETPGGDIYIPSRAIPVHARRSISRNTHYMLSSEEADQIRQDPRVLSVELSIEEQGLSFRPVWTQSSSLWNKSNTVSQFHQNWALLRCIEGTQRSGWGSDGVTNTTGVAQGTLTGKNVDVVIVDGLINPDHPEFALNFDGTGGSRVVQYNWFELNSYLGLGSNDTYVYTPYVDEENFELTDDNDHGAHVAGTAVGNSYGWARDAIIYNISPYGSAPSYTSYFIDYIRAWHLTKPINPTTGRRNPTITNHSYGLTYTRSISSITSVWYRGIEYTGPFTDLQLNNFGIKTIGTNAYLPGKITYLDADIEEAINEGIIFVGAASNDGMLIANYSESINDDYNNYVVSSGLTYYYNRGTVGASNNMICVGAVDTTVSETKATFSNCGPRIDVYAPGRSIMSSVNSTNGVVTNDYRNTSFKNTKKSGTSMASPQVCGILATVLETWPTMKQSQAVEYIRKISKLNQMTDSGVSEPNSTGLQGSINRYLYYYPERPVNGVVGPKSNFGIRPESGQTWPRTKIYKYGT